MSATPLPLRLNWHRLEPTGEVPVHDLGHVVPILGISTRDRVMVRLPALDVLLRSGRLIELYVREHKERATGRTDLVVGIDGPCDSLLCNIFECPTKLVQKTT